MADKPIGTLFVELDLDASRYTRGQQKLLRDAQSTSLNIEQNFKNLGIKSSAEMDLMRAKIANSYNMIANSSKASANDILRAERAKNEQLAALNKQQFGAQAGMIESIKGKWLALAGAGAAVFAAYRAVGQAVDLSELGAKLERQAASFENLAAAAGTSSRQVLAELKRASRGLVSEVDLMAASGKALLMNIPAAEIVKLMEIAAATSRTTGQTITEAFNDITMGVARQSRMILDNLGIIVDVDKANQEYAKALGKTASALTDTERRQAFMNAVLRSGADMARRIGDAQGDLEGVNRLLAAQSDLWGEIAKSVAQALDKEFGELASFVTWLGEKLKAMRADSAETSRQALLQEIEMLRSLEAKGMAFPGGADRKQAEYDRRYLAPQMNLKPSEELKRTGSWSTPRWDASGWRMQEGQYGELTEAEKKAVIDRRDEWLKRQAEAAKRTMEQLSAEVGKYRQEFQEALMGQSRLEEFQSGGRDQNAILRMEAERLARIREEAKKVYGEDGDYITRHREEIGPYDAERVKRTMDQIKNQGEESMGALVQLSQRTAEAMQANFSSLFFDAMKGELESLEDYVNAVMDSILRAISDMAGQLATQAIFGGGAVGGTAGGGGLVGWLAGLFGGGGAMSQSSALALVRHAGGAVDGSGPHRAIPAWMLAAAPRLHNGLAPDEYPAILQKGEWVLSRREANLQRGEQVLFNGGGAMSQSTALALVRHAGGAVDGSGPHRAVPAWMLAAAPRLHNGLAPDEYPAILQKGERVLSRLEANRPAASITINVAAPGGRMERESLSQLQAGLLSTLSRAYGRQR